MGVNFDKSGFNQKVNALRNLNNMFRQLPSHAAHWYMAEMVEDELNYGLDGQHIGRPTGTLARSVRVEDRSYSATVKLNGDGSAPYAGDVSNWTRREYGDTIIRLTTDRVKPTMLQVITDEWKRAAHLIEAGRPYTYNNPFFR
jgi:hypothetical protein